MTTSRMTAADIDQVMEIELEAFSMPWEKDAYIKEITENNCARYICMRSENGSVIAYAGMWFILDEAHVTTVAVRHDMRGKGFGEDIMQALMQKAADCGMRWMSLECRRSNIKAQNLYHKLGFIDVGYRKRYYYDNNEDALVMARLSLPEGNEENDEDMINEE